MGLALPLTLEFFSSGKYSPSSGALSRVAATTIARSNSPGDRIRYPRSFRLTIWVWVVMSFATSAGGFFYCYQA